MRSPLLTPITPKQHHEPNPNKPTSLPYQFTQRKLPQMSAVFIGSILVTSIPMNAQSQQVIGQTFSDTLIDEIIHSTPSKTINPKTSVFLRKPKIIELKKSLILRID